MPTFLDPNGNIFDRLKCCWFLFRYPNEFCQGVLNAYRAQIVARMSAEFHKAVEEVHGADAEPQTLSIEAAGIRAGQEAMNG